MGLRVGVNALVRQRGIKAGRSLVVGARRGPRTVPAPAAGPESLTTEDGELLTTESGETLTTEG